MKAALKEHTLGAAFFERANDLARRDQPEEKRHASQNNSRSCAGYTVCHLRRDGAGGRAGRHRREAAHRVRESA
jgi:hypothetical protein